MILPLVVTIREHVMSGFQYHDDRLFCELVNLTAVADSVGTPCFVYSGTILQEAYQRFQRALKPQDGLVCYALKANPNMALCKILASLGCGAEIVSGGELYKAITAGFPPHRIVFAGVGKTEEEIRFAINADILQLHVESVPELELVNRTARKLETRARVALRINPGVTVDTHPYVTTAAVDSKFGLDLDRAPQVLQRAAGLPGIRLTGLHFHLGSQITSVTPYQEALRRVIPLVKQLPVEGSEPAILDVGGGLAVSYDEQAVPTPEEWIGDIRQELGEVRCRLVVEPGRALVGPAGALISRVLYIKQTTRKTFLVVDAGMNDFLRPSLYGAYHQILPVRRREGQTAPVDVVGPVCESADFLARGREMIVPRAGDLLAVMNAGAYGSAMSSNYNGRPRAAEVLISGACFDLIGRRESHLDLSARDVVPPLAEDLCGRQAGKEKSI
jgi:diaminopimelate decarboxylase